MRFETYSEFKNADSSEKVGLCILNASKRLVGWTLYSGSVYQLSNQDIEVISSIEDTGVALVEVTSVGNVTAGKFYNDRTNKIIYLRTSDSVNPNGKFIGMTYKLFYSTKGVRLAHDLASGFVVNWLPMLQSTSDFGVELDNQNQLGVAIEGSGSVKLYNDQEYWGPIFDKVYFENQKAFVYSWAPGLPASEAKIIYRGRIQGKSWTPQDVTFQLKDFLNELRAPVELDNIEDVVGARVPDAIKKAKQRRIYGYVFGHRPTNVDQVLSSYPLTGTLSITTGSQTITGSGTSFLNDLSPNDEILLDGDTAFVTVESIASNTSLTITQEYEEITKSGVSFSVRPSHPKRYINREFVIAGHALTEPTTTVASAESTGYFTANSVTNFRQGDPITIGSETSEIENISDNVIFLTTTLVAIPSVGATVTRNAVNNVKINERELVLDRDYTYSASAGTLTLDPLAEFNVAPSLKLTGTVQFTSGSRSITGTGSFFKKDLAPGDWVRANGQFDFYEVLSVESDTAATLRTAAGYTANTSAYMKKPEVYDEGKTVLSLDVLGLSDDGTTGGDLLYRGPEIVEDILKRAGLTAELNTASFSTANNLTEHRVGLVIPEGINETKGPSVRDVVNLINRSVFGSLIQNNDFELAYSVLEPARTNTITKLTEADVLKFSVKSNSDRIVKDSVVEYGFYEYDPVSKGKKNAVYSSTNDDAQYLADSLKEFKVKTCLVDEYSAQIMSQRWGLVFSSSSSEIRLETKLQLADASVTDQIEIEHEKLYERIGSNSKRKVAGVQLSKKSVLDCQVELEDLANSFSRCGTITPDDALDFADASEDEAVYNGYITDAYGMQDNDPVTHGANIIW